MLLWQWLTFLNIGESWRTLAQCTHIYMMMSCAESMPERVKIDILLHALSNEATEVDNTLPTEFEGKKEDIIDTVWQEENYFGLFCYGWLYLYRQVHYLIKKRKETFGKTENDLITDKIMFSINHHHYCSEETLLKESGLILDYW